MKQGDVILVIDDEEAGRFVKVQTLRRAGFNVIEAANGLDGLELAEGARPMLVVCDVNLPDISGLEVTRRLRASEQGPPALQILQISNTAIQTADRVRGLDQGADVYLTEPVEGEVLVATVHALLRVRRAETALAAALESEKRARAHAEEASRLKDEFIATLSHELRTPLNALMGWIWQLQHTALTDEARRRALESLERNARTQAQLINDLLDVSRISKGKLVLEMRLVDLAQIAVTVCETLREAVARKRLELRVTTEPVYVAGDQGRLQQIITNLVTNAVQFTPADGEIEVSVTPQGEDAVLRVQDTGAGIDANVLPHIFDPFRQGEGGLSRQHGGLGLGLAVVRQLVELHGGSTDVESPGVGLGATFIVRVPRETAVPARVRELDAQPLLAGLTVTVVTGEGYDAQALAATLESSGASVTLTDPAGAADAKADLIITPASGRLTMKLAASAPEPQSVPVTAPPGVVARQIARFVAAARTS